MLMKWRVSICDYRYECNRFRMNMWIYSLKNSMLATFQWINQYPGYIFNEYKSSTLFYCIQEHRPVLYLRFIDFKLSIEKKNHIGNTV